MKNLSKFIPMVLVIGSLLFQVEAIGQTAVHYDAAGLPIPVPAVGTGGFPCDGGPVTSIITVSETGTIGIDATLDAVGIDIKHTWDSDLEIDLISPAGTIWDLTSDNGGSFDNYTNTIFADGNPSIVLGIPPFTGSFEAEQGPFSVAYANESITGDWVLSMCDDTGGEVGELLAFSMDFSTAIPPTLSVHFDAAGLPIPVPAVGTGGFPCDGGPVTSTITVSETGTIGIDATLDAVGIDIKHTYDSDLEIDLISPAGTTWDLTSDNGGAGDNYTNTIFADGNPSIILGIPPFTGSFEAEQGPFSVAYANESITGDWVLSICDDAGGEVGELLAFSMDFSIPITMIPTLSQWGLIVLLLSLSIVGIVFIFNNNPKWVKAIRCGYAILFFLAAGTIFVGFEYYEGLTENPTYKRLHDLYQSSNGESLTVSKVKGMVETNSSNFATWQFVLQYHNDNPGADPASMTDLERMVEGMEEKMSK